jgi:ADP-heptose:LPS heptosyltransferase
LEFARFLPANNADWISLQVGGNVDQELNQLSQHLQTLAANRHPASDAAEGLPAITNAGGQFEDFFDTAQTTLTTDRVIAVDTAVAHLAGALGHPTAILLPDPPDWRWGLGSPRSLWYPRTHLDRRHSTISVDGDAAST